jgi:hypothetical protein
MLVETAAVEPSPLCPDPSREKWREEEERAQDPPSLPLLSLQAPDRHDRARADPQHSAAETNPLQHASEAAVPGVAFAHCQGPRTGHLLAALALGLPSL